MLIKWIRCHVPEETREAFGIAQRSWSASRSCPGFLGQIGGWRAGDETEAVVLALWRDRPAYNAFMTTRHDEIAAGSGQAGTYRSSTVCVYEELIRMPGALPSLERALDAEQDTGETRFIRAADCSLRPGRDAHFEQMQRTLWLPAMQEAEGMLAGVFAVEPGADTRRLVVTLWSDEAAHASYVCDMLPGLRAHAEVDLDAERVDGIYVRVEPAWTVVGSASA